MQNILLLGGNGFLGNILTNDFLKHDYNVYIVDGLAPKIINKKVTYFTNNIKDSNNVIEIIKNNSINIVIHLISTLIPASTYIDYEVDIQSTYIPLVGLLKYCSEHKIKFIFSSSGGTVYGSQSGILRETSKVDPISFYGLSKIQIEQLILYYNENFGLNYLILRPSNPYGYGQNIHGKQGLIAVALGKILHNEPIQIFGDGDNVRDYIFSEDFSYYVVNLVEKNITNQIINIGSGIGYSINDVIGIINEVINKKVNIVNTESRKVDVKSIVMDINKLESFVHLKQKTLKDGIADFYNKLLTNGDK